MRWTDRRVGPVERATERDIPVLNRLFSDAFTERYRRDGMSGVRVPFLNSEVWGYAIANAGAGAFVWRDGRGDIIAFNMVHRSGREGWMGPLAVRPDRQEEGLGRRIVQHGVDWLRTEGATTIGLETMPRTVENIGFYSRLGFLPGPLTLTLQGPARAAGVPTELARLSAASGEGAETTLAAAAEVTDRVASGADFSREWRLTRERGLGDLAVLGTAGAPTAWVLWHTVPLAHGRSAEELRVLKLAAVDLESARVAIAAAAAEASRLGLAHVTLRCQGSQAALYAGLVGDGWRVQWTDLRMTLAGYPECPTSGILVSNWEI